MAGSPHALVVPGLNDLNRGDQALAWEAAALARDSGLFGGVYLLDSGDSASERERQVGRSVAAGYRLARRILPHPRRARHDVGPDRVRDRPGSVLRLARHAVADLARYGTLLRLARSPRRARRLLSPEQYATYGLFRSAGAVFVKGGGFLHAYGGIADPYYIWYQLFYVRLALALGRPVVVLPNSFGPFRGRTVRAQLRAALARCALLTARETRSARALGKLLARRIPVFADMAYLLEPAGRAQGERICREHGVPLGERPCVGFTVRPYRFPGSSRPRERFGRFLDAVARLVRHVVAEGFHPVLLTQALGPGAHEDDRLAIRSLLPRIGGIAHSRVEHDGGCREQKAVCGCMDLLVGTRFHSIIFAQASGVPAMAIAYGGNKAPGIMADMGLERFVVAIEDVGGPALCHIFDELRREAPSVKRALASWMEQARADRERLLDLVRETLRPGAAP